MKVYSPFKHRWTIGFSLSSDIYFPYYLYYINIKEEHKVSWHFKVLIFGVKFTRF